MGMTNVEAVIAAAIDRAFGFTNSHNGPRAASLVIEALAEAGLAVTSTPDAFAEYLAQPCDMADCSSTATHNQSGRRVCNRHLDNTPGAAPAFARND